MPVSTKLCRVCLALALAGLLSACNGGGSGAEHSGEARLAEGCVSGASCNTRNPCTTGQTVCTADGRSMCVVVDVLFPCPLPMVGNGPELPVTNCVPNAPCASGHPCTTGITVCGADDIAHCVATVDLPNCPNPEVERDCVEGAPCNTGDPCTTGRTMCGAWGRNHCIAASVLPGCRSGGS